LTWHNVQYYQDLMAGLRESIGASNLDAFVKRFHNIKSQGDIEQL
jgi:queuine tRNA-ribosyltransferase